MTIRWDNEEGTILIHTSTKFVRLYTVLMTEEKKCLQKRAGRFTRWKSHSRSPWTHRLAHGKVG